MQVLGNSNVDPVSAEAIKEARLFWSNHRIDIVSVSNRVVVDHPQTRKEGSLVASGEFENMTTPHDSVVVHYRGDGPLAIFEEPVLLPPHMLAHQLGVLVSDLPHTTIAGFEPAKVICLKDVGGHHLQTEVSGEIHVGEQIEALSELNTALDNYHKNFHFFKDKFNIDTSSLNNLRGVCVEIRDDEAPWQLARYQSGTTNTHTRDVLNPYTGEIESLSRELAPEILFTFANKGDAEKVHHKLLAIAHAYR
jgi:hypothetical protein